jgi:hypothetical protein
MQIDYSAQAYNRADHGGVQHPDDAGDTGHGLWTNHWRPPGAGRSLIADGDARVSQHLQRLAVRRDLFFRSGVTQDQRRRG